MPRWTKLEMTYPVKGPTGHGVMGTTVTYFPRDGVFYVVSNCVMNHLDAPLGPFVGDPRQVLRAGS